MDRSGKDEATNEARMETSDLTSRLVSYVQTGMLSSVFIKVERMQEKFIHKDSTRCIVESLRAGINRKKATNVKTTPAKATSLKVYYGDVSLLR